MWNIPTEERLKRIPRLYETENVPPRDELIYLHFFIGDATGTSPNIPDPRRRLRRETELGCCIFCRFSAICGLLK
jgi:hypothetical protein